MRTYLRIVVGIALWLIGTGSALAQIPPLIRYQGQAVDSNGVPLEGPYTLIFRLYGAETGGAAVWEETQTNVPLTGGHFSVLLGEVESLEPVDWSVPLWLGIQVNTEPELAPRQRITSVPLAIRAQTAEVVKTSGLTDDANGLVPAGAIILWDGSSCPAGYTRLTAYDGKFLVGSSAAGSGGGSNTHNHGGATGSHALTISEIPSHSHGIRGHANAGGPGPNWFPNTSDPVFTTTESAGGGAGHTHPISAVDNRPEFMTILLCKKN